MMYKLYNFEFPDELLQSITPKYYSGLYTTYFNEKDINCATYYHGILDTVTKDLGLNHRCKYTNYIWAQVYDKTIGHGLHDHYSPSTLFSWVHFINPLDTKCFFFIDTEGNKFYPPQQKNDFIIFPSWASHEVEETHVKGRAIVAGNVRCDIMEASLGVSTHTNIHEKLSVWEVKDPT